MTDVGAQEGSAAARQQTERAGALQTEHRRNSTLRSAEYGWKLSFRAVKTH